MEETPFLSPIKLKGKLLLASPSMEDPFFEKTVIIMTEHNTHKGAKGFILNKPLEQRVAGLTDNAPGIPSELSSIEVFQGGPVEESSLSICGFTTQKNKLLYKPEINREQAIALLQTPGTLIRCFAGYTSWVPGQLENELSEGSWIILPAFAPLLGMTHDTSLWRCLLESTSPLHFLLSRAPKHPFFN